jgi:eukaryotic-like serine/threonine-protein kinase
MSQILTEEPTPPRKLDRSIPADLEIIVLKCLEKDPVHRYASAQAVGDDLQAWLDGEPILARPPSIRYLLTKRLHRHRALALSIGIVVVLASVFGVYTWLQREAAATRVALAQELSLEIAQNTSASRTAELLPIHDMRQSRKSIETSLLALQSRMASIGGAVEGPLHYAVGSGFLEIDRPEDARRELEQAWTLDYRTPEVAYALGLAYTQLYRRALAEMDPAGEKEARPELERRFSAPALAYLRQSRGVRDRSPDYVEALIALNERRYDDAIAKAEKARAEQPALFEALTLEGDVHLARSRMMQKDPSVEAKLAELDAAGTSYQAAAQIARSSVSALRGDCDRLVATACLLEKYQRSPALTATQAAEACNRLLVALPDDGAAYASQAVALTAVATYRTKHGDDALEVWQEIERTGDRALAAGPQDLAVLEAVALDRRHQAEYFLRYGRDPRPLLTTTIELSERAAKLDPRSAMALVELCRGWALRGDWEADHGGDPKPAIATAVNAANAAVRLATDPEATEGSNECLGVALLTRGEWERRTSVDPTDTLKQAIAALEHAGSGVTVLANRCSCWGTLAYHDSEANRSPYESLRQARASCSVSFAAAPSPDVASGLASLDDAEARWAIDHGDDPTSAIKDGRGWVAKALELNPRNDDAYGTLGRMESDAGQWEEKQGRSPMARFDAARKAYQSALLINPRDATNVAVFANLYSRIAGWKLKAHLPVAADVAAGIELAERALAIDPNLAYGHYYLGELDMLAAGAKSGAAKRAVLARAKSELEKAIALDHDLVSPVSPDLKEIEGALDPKRR